MRGTEGELAICVRQAGAASGRILFCARLADLFV